MTLVKSLHSILSIFDPHTSKARYELKVVLRVKTGSVINLYIIC